MLGVWALNTNSSSADPLVADAIAKAGAAAFLSSDNNAFCSRTAGDIVQQHFPPGIANKAPGPLVGVNFSSLGFSDINKLKAPGSVISYGSSPGLTLVAPPMPITGGLRARPAACRFTKMVCSSVPSAWRATVCSQPTSRRPSSPTRTPTKMSRSRVRMGFQPSDTIFASQVFIAGIRLEYIESSTSLGAVIPFASLPGKNISPFTFIASPPPYPYPVATLGGETGELRQPIIADPSTVPLPGGTARLTAEEVTNIIAAAANRARTTRAGIRLPRGSVAQMYHFGRK